MGEFLHFIAYSILENDSWTAISDIVEENMKEKNLRYYNKVVEVFATFTQQEN